MKIWTSEHVFSHPWETVVTASWRKYPNPMNPAIVGIDVLERHVSNGILKSHRLIRAEWGLPHWAVKLIGASGITYASEHSEVDQEKKTMTLLTRNLSFSNELSIMEKLTYFPHPTQPSFTLLKQEAVITVHGVPLSNYIENFISSTISANASKGRQAIERVINLMNSQI